ncbi:hypothetical protein LDENG_00258750 [Lucifuga dentata]|nr:hypothetical protein LDENG_00258750 [Lucifuga dentata]
MVVAVSCYGVLLSSRDRETGRLVRTEGRMDAADPERSLKKTCCRVQPECRLGQRFTFQHKNDLKHPAKTMLERLQDKSLTVPEWSSQSPD